MAQLNRVQRTVLDQVARQNPFWRVDYGVKQVIKKDKYTVRLYTVNNGDTVNIDIEYTPMDTYNLQLHKVNGGVSTEIETKEHKHIYFDQLDRVIRKGLDDLVTIR